MYIPELTTVVHQDPSKDQWVRLILHPGWHEWFAHHCMNHGIPFCLPQRREIKVVPLFPNMAAALLPREDSPHRAATTQLIRSDAIAGLYRPTLEEELRFRQEIAYLLHHPLDDRPLKIKAFSLSPYNPRDPNSSYRKIKDHPSHGLPVLCPTPIRPQDSTILTFASISLFGNVVVAQPFPSRNIEEPPISDPAHRH